MRASCWLGPLLLAACAGPTPRTEVMLAIDAEPAVRAATGHLEIHVLGAQEGTPLAGYASRYERTIDAVTWPWRVGMVPLDPSPPRAWLAEIRALRPDGTTLTASSVRGGYAEKRTVLVSMVLEDACIGVVCDRMRCVAGACVDPSVGVSAAPNVE